MTRKPNPDPDSVYVSLSFSAPAELETPMNQAAAARGMNRSQFICWLVQQYLYHAQIPSSAKVPPRIRRGKPKRSKPAAP